MDACLRLDDREPRFCEQVAMTHRAPTLEMMVHIIRLVPPGDGLTWNHKNHPSSSSLVSHAAISIQTVGAEYA